MNRLYKKIAAFVSFTLIVLILAGQTQTAYAAGAPYRTRSVDQYGNNFITKDGYLPLQTIEKFGEKDLRDPSDIAFSPDDFMYIADTGNARVVKLSKNGDFVQEIGVDVLAQPKGVFVNKRGELYVADVRQKKVFMFDSEGTLIKEYTHPNDILYGKSNDFKPLKVASDNAGNVYVLSDGNTNGIIQLSKEGDFFGYVGANKTPLTFREIIQRLTFTSDQRSQLKMNVPVSPGNLAIDDRGLIYTITQGGSSDGIKKFNMAGVNMLDWLYVDSLVADICIDSIGNIITVSSDGYIAEYTNDGEFLFLFGGRDDGYNRDGLFVSASGIALDSTGRLYVLDSELKNVTIFKTTEYADTVHLALNLHQKGYYVESREPWEHALRQDALFDRAHRGIGESYYKLEMYDKALHSFRLGYSYSGYSDSFWEIRNEWLMNNLSNIFIILLLLWIVFKIVNITDKRFNWLHPVRKLKKWIGDKTIVKQLAFIGYIPKNPADAFYGIKFENKVSIKSATIIYVLFFFIYIANKYATGFLFKSVIDGYYEIPTDIAVVFGAFALAVVCNNLVCSISDGEGKMWHVYCAFAYCLTPYILIKPFVIMLSHVLTFNENFIISFSNFLIYGAIGILVVIMVKEIQAYTLGKTIRCLLLTLFTMAMLIVTGIIMFALINQVIDFITSIGREVYFRAS